MALLTDSQKKTVAAAVAKTKAGDHRVLDPADADDAAAIKCFLELTGKTPESHPALFADLERGVAATQNPDDHSLRIVDSGVDSQGRATCRAWHLDRRGALMSGSLALALDGDSGDALAMGHANRVGGGLTPAATRTASARKAGKNLTSVGFYHSQAAPDTPPHFGMMAAMQPVDLAVQAVLANVTQPVISKQGNTEVNIALGRQTGPDADYFYPQDTNNSPILLVPFVGTVNVQQPLNYVDPSTGNFTQGLTVSTQLYSTAGHSYSPSADSTQKLTSNIVGNTSTNVVSWNFPYQQHNEALSLWYNPLAAANDTVSAFYFQFNIPVSNPVAPVYSFNVCSYDWPDQPSVNCYQISNLKYWWHCVAGDAEVTLTDGTTLPIGDIDNTMRVRTVHGGSLAVEATTRGQHTVSAANHPADRIYRLTTRGGLALVLTGGHPVVTPDGLVRASDLSEGDAVLTLEGVDHVAGCEEVGAPEVFCNLNLGDADDRSKGRGTTVGTFFANGIAVGDFDSMANLHHNNVHSLDYMRARLPERYHTDYASTLGMIQSDNLRYGGSY